MDFVTKKRCSFWIIRVFIGFKEINLFKRKLFGEQALSLHTAFIFIGSKMPSALLSFPQKTLHLYTLNDHLRWSPLPYPASSFPPMATNHIYIKYCRLRFAILCLNLIRRGLPNNLHQYILVYILKSSLRGHGTFSLQALAM